jgi:hypothetical protein
MDSLSWKDAEVMVVGSSGLGPILRVFLGSNSGKIVCNSPVPCIILPRSGEADAAWAIVVHGLAKFRGIRSRDLTAIVSRIKIHDNS